MHGAHRDLHVLPPSFPTRRSSDLIAWRDRLRPMLRDDAGDPVELRLVGDETRVDRPRIGDDAQAEAGGAAAVRHRPADVDGRSEEHTSELQSLMRISYAVFGLKKKIANYIIRISRGVTSLA